MVRVAVAVMAAMVALTATARADEYYRVLGSDRLRIGGSEMLSSLSYNGTEQLRITMPAKNEYLYKVFAQCRVLDGRTARPLTATADVTFGADGEQRALHQNDPAYLTIVTQPFAVALDRKTLTDVARLNRPEPFTFSSPMTGANLRGLLRRLEPQPGDEAGTIGIGFTADGPISGTLPGDPDLGLTGRMHMEGRAIYRRSDALLVGLDDTLTISGRVGSAARGAAIQVVYARSIHHVPAPAPLATPAEGAQAETPKSLLRSAPPPRSSP